MQGAVNSKIKKEFSFNLAVYFHFVDMRISISISYADCLSYGLHDRLLRSAQETLSTQFISLYAQVYSL